MSRKVDLTDYEKSGIFVDTLFDRKKISRDEDYERHLMIKIRAEDSDFERKSVSIALCIDRSGSMQGGKLESVKETARKIVENLSSRDEIAIITFDNYVDIAQERINCSDKEKLYQVISSITCGGSTNMSGGLLDSFRQINETLEGVKRVMLLTDGHANAGVSDREGLLNLIKNRDSSCTISTFGYGNGCDQELLADMAKEGSGNYYYIGDNSDVKDVFARELGGILSCVAQGIEVKVKPGKGNEVVGILNNYTVEDKDGVATIRAEDIYVEETKYVLVKMKIGKPGGKVKDRPFSIAKVEVEFYDLKTSKKLVKEDNVKVEFVKKDQADKEPILEVAERVATFVAAKAQVEAVKLAGIGDYDGAQSVLRVASAGLFDMADAGSELVASVMDGYEDSIKSFSSTAYNSTIGQQLRSANMGYMRGRSTASSSASSGSVSSTSSTSSGTSAQKRMLSSFNSGTEKTKKAVGKRKPANSRRAKEPSKFGKKRKQTK